VSQVGDIIHPFGRPERVLERVPIPAPEYGPPLYYALKTEPVEDPHALAPGHRNPGEIAAQRNDAGGRAGAEAVRSRNQPVEGALVV
jgi:hypothetical protein